MFFLNPGTRSITRGKYFCLRRIVAPILGIAIVKIPAETLKQRTILFKLILMLVNLLRSVSDTSRNAATKMQNAGNHEVLGNGPDFLASSIMQG
jgi:hypothetical protein